MKKALVLASVASMIDQFNMPNILLLKELGYEVDVVANFTESGSITSERTENLKMRLLKLGVNVINVPIPRKIFAIKNILKSYKVIKKLCNENNYNLLHCHSPIGGAIARLGARRARKSAGTKVIYTAHGFHFYKGAPLKNWILFYTIEKYCARFTDVLITINKEDYSLAKSKMKAKRVEYLPGVGVDVAKFSKNEQSESARSLKRKEMQISESDVILLSVGELNENKNHSVIIDAIARLNDKNVKYFIVGKGHLKEELEKKIANNKLENQVFLLGFRTDVAEIYKACDIFVFPSYREGLSVSIMEAMASNLPCVVSRIRGNTDLIDSEKGGFLCEPFDAIQFQDYIKRLIESKVLREKFGEYNSNKIQNFSVENVMEKTKEIYLG